MDRAASVAEAVLVEASRSGYLLEKWVRWPLSTPILRLVGAVQVEKEESEEFPARAGPAAQAYLALAPFSAASPVRPAPVTAAVEEVPVARVGSVVVAPVVLR